MAQVALSPSVLEWARKRAGVPLETLAKRFKRYSDWREGRGGPTFQQLESLANTLNIPVGMMFLTEPPVEKLPLPDFRRMADIEAYRPSTELIDTIHTCQRRQQWYREHLASAGADVLEFVGSAALEESPIAIANKIRAKLDLTSGNRSGATSFEEFLRQFVFSSRDLGILVMINGVVGNNTRRPLNPREFRGFAISDPFAPLIFINGADSKAGQIFTLAHELGSGPVNPLAVTLAA